MNESGGLRGIRRVRWRAGGLAVLLVGGALVGGALLADAVAASSRGVAAATTGPSPLIGQWHLDDLGSDGATATDSSGQGNDLSVQNAINSPLIPGRFGDAYSFSNSLDLRRDGAALQPAQLTVLAWVKSTGSAPAVNSYIVAEGEQACNGASYALRVGGNGGLQFYAWGGPSVSVSPTADSSASVWDGNWHAVAGTYDGTSVHLYVDGAEVGSAAPGPAAGIDYDLSNQDFTVGTFPAACSTPNFTGAVDEARVYDEALTPSQINQLQTATGPDPPVLGGGTTTTTTTTTTTSTPPTTPPPIARLSAASGTAGKPVLVSAVGSEFPGDPAKSYTFQLGRGPTGQTVCPGRDPVLSAIVAKSVSSATNVTVTTTGGATSTASSSIFVAPAQTIPTVKLTKVTTKKGHISAAGGTSLGPVPVLATECLPAGGNTAKMAKAPPVGAIKPASQAPTTSAGGTPGCADQVDIGIVQGLGCFQLVDAGHPLPQAEASILCQYQYACTGLKANSTLYKILEGGTASAAGVSVGSLGADVIYYSTQPVRIDGLEVDPVAPGGAIVLALAGTLSSQSTFITKDAAYLISSDAVVKVGDLPVSLHIPDYQAAYQNASAALNKGQAAYNNASSLNPVNLSDINIPNPKNLIPSTDGPINLAVSLSKVGEELGEFEVPGKILPVDDLPKLPLTGSVKVNLLANGGASVAVHVALPDVLSDGNGHGLTGDTTLSIDNTNGLELNNLHILIPSASDVGSAGLKSLELTYSRQPQLFDGKMVLDLGYATIGGELRLENGDFKSASLSYQADQGQGIAIYPPVYLVALSGTLSVNPTTISSTSQISIGPAASTGCGPVGVTGTTSVSFGNPVAFDTSGAFALNCGNYGYNAGLHFDSDGNLAGRVGIGYSIPNIAKVGGELELQAYTDLKNTFIAQVDGKLQAVVTVHECEGPVCGDSGPINVDAQAVISLGTNNRHAVGTAGLCVNVKLLGVGFSVGAGTSDLPSLLAIGVGQGSFSDVASHFSILFDGCNISTWQLLKPNAGFTADGRPLAGSDAASGPEQYPVTVTPATKTAAIGVTGSGGAPMVQITGPGGKTIDAMTPDGISNVAGALVVRDSQTDETLVEIPHPAAGKWRVAPAPGSVAITAVRQAHTLPMPVIQAHVTGRGAKRTLRYAIVPQPGLKVTFLEGIGRSVNLIGNATRTRGTLRFAPGLGSSKPRTIEARIVRNGQLFGTLVVARWSPGRLQPGRVSRLKVTHSRSGTRVSFEPAPLAIVHQVTIRFADGQELLEILPAGKHTVTIPARIDATTPTAVAVVGLRGTTRGPTVILNAGRPR